MPIIDLTDDELAAVTAAIRRAIEEDKVKVNVYGMTRPCTFPDCQSPAVAKGLCAKHYMRLRRHGVPAKVDRPGRKKGDSKARKLLRETSDRNYARYWRALRLLSNSGLDAKPVLARCTRDNGSVNFAMLERLTEGMATMRLVEQISRGVRRG